MFTHGFLIISYNGFTSRTYISAMDIQDIKNKPPHYQDLLNKIFGDFMKKYEKNSKLLLNKKLNKIKK